MTEATEQLGLLEAFKLKEVKTLWLAQIVSVFGDFLVLFAVLSVASFRWHATPAQITFISISFMLPFAVIGPIAGVFVDRWNVKRTMITSDLIRSVLALSLVFASSLNQIYLILLLLSTVSTFFMPAQTVTIRTIVPRAALMSANALMQQAFQIVRIVSPALAGAAVAWLGASACYYVDSVSFIFSAIMISTLIIQREPVAASEGNRFKSVLKDLNAGVKFIFTHPLISFVVLAMAAGFFAISCFGPLIAVYVRDILKADSMMFGFINSLIGVGMIVGTLSMHRFSRRSSKSHLPLIGLFTMGVFVSLMAVFSNVPVTATAMFGVGIGAVLIFVSAQTIMQGHTPIELMGRVSSSVWSVLSFAQLIGLAFAGSMAQALGVKNMFYASAVFLALIACLGYFFLPQQTSEPAEATQ